MTHHPDGINPEEPFEPGGRSGEARRLDEDAAWRAIIENYGDEPDVEAYYNPPESSTESVESPRAEPRPPAEPVVPRWQDSLNSEASWNDEGHFIPPEPPPLPKIEPRRKLAWIGLFGAPLVMLVCVVLGWSYPGWVGFLLVCGFLGGFAYLVATMPRSRPDDGSGDDGAVV